jgi:hypothetical protein
MSRNKLLVAGAILAGLPLGGALGSYIEDWDSAPSATGWYWFQAGAGADGDVTLSWAANSPDPGGYLVTSLDDVTHWSAIPVAHTYFTTYAYGSNPPGVTRPLHPIQPSLDTRMEIAFRDGGGASLSGGQLFFWVGQWNSASELAFYYLNVPLSGATAPSWTQNSFTISQSPGDWVTLVQEGPLSLSGILGNPQQWGFGVFGGSAEPVGSLALDSLRSYPAPAPLTAALLLPGLLALGARRRG